MNYITQLFLLCTFGASVSTWASRGIGDLSSLPAGTRPIEVGGTKADLSQPFFITGGVCHASNDTEICDLILSREPSVKKGMRYGFSATLVIPERRTHRALRVLNYLHNNFQQTTPIHVEAEHLEGAHAFGDNDILVTRIPARELADVKVRVRPADLDEARKGVFGFVWDK